MKDTLRENCDSTADCIKNCCVSRIIAPIFFVIFVLMAQFVLVNVVVAVLMKHLEESHKQVTSSHPDTITYPDPYILDTVPTKLFKSRIVI